MVPVVSALLVLSGCGSDAASLSWRVRFELDEDRDRAAAVEVTILRGGCSSGGLAEYKELLGRGERPRNAPEPLGAGEYGFRARARDASCRIIAEGCRTVALPTDEAIVVVLQTGSSAAPACPADVCDGAGRCPGEWGYGGASGPDGGEPADARPPTTDGGGDCGPCRQRSAAGVCEPMLDGASCSEGGRTGTCRSGSCCTGCVDMGVCQPGDRAEACGAGGFACSRCGPCERCNADGDCEPVADMTDCTVDMTTGKCLDGSCCTGCLIENSMGVLRCVDLSAQDPGGCGRAGAMCMSCPGLQVCCNGMCQDGSCS